MPSGLFDETEQLAEPEARALPTPLVVQKESNARSITSGDIPMPESLTETMAYWPGATSGCSAAYAYRQGYAQRIRPQGNLGRAETPRPRSSTGRNRPKERFGTRSTKVPGRRNCDLNLRLPRQGRPSDVRPATAVRKEQTTAPRLGSRILPIARPEIIETR
jgi:hypothetical protein